MNDLMTIAAWDCPRTLNPPSGIDGPSAKLRFVCFPTEIIRLLTGTGSCLIRILTSMSISPTCTVRPEFTGTLAIKAGRHPILGIIKTAGALVPNDTYCCDSSSFQLIRGPKLSIDLASPLPLPRLPLTLISCLAIFGAACQVRNLCNVTTTRTDQISHPGRGRKRIQGRAHIFGRLGF